MVCARTEAVSGSGVLGVGPGPASGGWGTSESSGQPGDSLLPRVACAPGSAPLREGGAEVPQPGPFIHPFGKYSLRFMLGGGCFVLWDAKINNNEGKGVSELHPRLVRGFPKPQGRDMKGRGVGWAAATSCGPRASTAWTAGQPTPLQGAGREGHMEARRGGAGPGAAGLPGPVTPPREGRGGGQRQTASLGEAGQSSSQLSCSCRRETRPRFLQQPGQSGQCDTSVLALAQR